MDLRSSARRVLFATVVVPATLVASVGCGATTRTATPSAPRQATFNNGYLAFTYPAGWNTLRPPGNGALSDEPLLSMSTQAGHEPCRGDMSEVVCGWPISRLRPSGVLVTWENRGWPGWSLASARGRAITVGGRRARLQVAQPGRCSTIGARETISVVIERPVANNWTQLTACLRGPDLSTRERQIKALLASTRFLAP